ncbi:MAG: hypothetical protein HOW73_39400 [Polyangiaceae bacterium]|nr:hypothetical protein [Polyangiaceae bacterium]
MEEFADEPSSWNSSLDVVLAWCDAVEARDFPRAISLCHEDVELEWPRGLGRGTRLLVTWVGPRKWGPPSRAFQRGRLIVVERGAAGAANVSAVVPEAVFFEVNAARLARIGRYRSLRDALREASLSLDDEVIFARRCDDSSGWKCTA